MKVEVGSFTVNSSSPTYFFNDANFQAKGMQFITSKTLSNASEGSIGFSDGVRNRAKSNVVSSSNKDTRQSTSHCIYHYSDVSGTITQKMAGKIATSGLSTVGEFSMTFDSYDSSYSVYFVAWGE